MAERRADTIEPRSNGLYISPPVQRAALLLRHIAEGDSVANMSRTARELGINRTTLIRLLHTLDPSDSSNSGRRAKAGASASG